MNLIRAIKPLKTVIVLLLLLSLAVACSSKGERSSYRFDVKKIYAVEGRKQWDLFDDRPELYFVFKTDDSSFKSEASSRGAWERSFEDPAQNQFTLWDFGASNFEIYVYDSDNGDNDDSTDSSSSFFGDLAFSLINDSDDLVMERKFVITTDSGTIELKNEFGGIVFDYKRL